MSQCSQHGDGLVLGLSVSYISLMSYVGSCCNYTAVGSELASIVPLSTIQLLTISSSTPLNGSLYTFILSFDLFIHYEIRRLKFIVYCWCKKLPIWLPIQLPVWLLIWLPIQLPVQFSLWLPILLPFQLICPFPSPIISPNGNFLNNSITDLITSLVTDPITSLIIGWLMIYIYTYIYPHIHVCMFIYMHVCILVHMCKRMYRYNISEMLSTSRELH